MSSGFNISLTVGLASHILCRLTFRVLQRWRAKTSAGPLDWGMSQNGLASNRVFTISAPFALGSLLLVRGIEEAVICLRDFVAVDYVRRLEEKVGPRGSFDCLPSEVVHAWRHRISVQTLPTLLMPIARAAPRDKSMSRP